MKKIKTAHKFIIYSVFALSGIAGLIYETIWSQYLGLFLGHAAYAQTLTLAIFMGGMAIGSFLISLRSQKIKNAIMLYALIELTLGFLGLFFHGIFTTVTDFSFNHIFPTMQSPFLINVVKWLIASLLILPQSILLGSTFPLISTGLIRRIGRSEGSLISMLYFSNSIGASVGAIITTFLLVPHVGLPGALMVAAVLNIVVAIVIYLPAKKEEPKYSYNLKHNKEIKQESLNHYNTKLFLIVALMTGFASFIYEITWIRMLNLVFGTSLHAFEIMLSSFILGLALGGLWIKRRIDSIGNIVKYLGVIQVIMGTMAILTMPLYMESFSWLATLLKDVLMKSDLGYTFYNFITAAFAILVMLPAAFCAGMTLPLLTTTLLRKGDGEKSIGKIYSANTIGGLLGVWFAIHIGMVFLGLKNMLLFASIIDASLGVILIKLSQNKNKNKNGNKVIDFSYASVVFYLLLFIPIILFLDFSLKTISSGVYRTHKIHGDNINVLYYKDGKSASISVIEQLKEDDEHTKKADNKSKIVVIATNGKPDAGILMNPMKEDTISGDEPTMVLLGTIPLLIKPEAQLVANIGFGSGLSSSVLLSSDKIKNLDTIEIEPSIIEGARFFYPRNANVYDDPRSNIIIEDAKTFFASHNKKYDIISSEPSNPWVIGVGNLFSKEFYSNIKKYLKKDGILVQWIQLYEISPQVIGSAINALASEFGYFDAYLANSSDLILISSQEPIPSFSKEFFKNTKLQNKLKKINITLIESIITRKVGDQSNIAPFFSYFTKSINSDFYPLISLFAPKDRFMRRTTDIFEYTKLDVPVFELLGNQISINKLLLSDENDMLNPFTQFNSIFYIVDYLVNEKAPKNLNAKIFGEISIIKEPEAYCKNDNKVWLNAFDTIYNRISLIGFEALYAVSNSHYLKTCANITKNNSIKLYFDLIQLFSNQKYQTFINLVLNDNRFSLINKNIQRTLLNKALFAAIKLKGEMKQVDLKKLKELNNSITYNRTTIWLNSYLTE